MADDHGSTAAGTAVEKTVDTNSGIAVIEDSGLVNPGEPEHRLRVTDLNPQAAQACIRVR